jgi:hypothetical protein
MQNIIPSIDNVKDRYWSNIKARLGSSAVHHTIDSLNDASWLATISSIEELNASYREAPEFFFQNHGNKLSILFENLVLFCNDEIYPSVVFASLVTSVSTLFVTQSDKDTIIQQNLLKSLNNLDLKRMKSGSIVLTKTMLVEYLEKQFELRSSYSPSRKEIFKKVVHILKAFAKNWNNDTEVVQTIISGKVKGLSQRFDLINNLLKVKFLNEENFNIIQKFAAGFSFQQLFDREYFLENYLSNNHLKILSSDLIACVEKNFQDLFANPDGLRKIQNGKKPFKKHITLVNIILAIIGNPSTNEEIVRKHLNYLLHILKLFKVQISKNGQNQSKNNKLFFVEIYHLTLKKLLINSKSDKTKSFEESDLEKDIKQFSFEFFLFLIPLNVCDEFMFKDCFLMMKKAFGTEFKEFLTRKVLLINEKDEIKKEILINFMAKCSFLMWDINDETFYDTFESKIAFLISRETNPINEKIHEYFFGRLCFHANADPASEFIALHKEKVLYYFIKIFDNNYMLQYRVNYKILSTLNIQLNDSEVSQLLEMATNCCIAKEGEVEFDDDKYFWPTLKSFIVFLSEKSPKLVSQYATNMIVNLITIEKIDEDIFKENFKTKEAKTFLKLALSFPTSILQPEENFAEYFFIFSHLISLANISWMPMYKAVSKRLLKISSAGENSVKINDSIRENLVKAIAIVSSSSIQSRRNEFIVHYSLVNYLSFSEEDIESPVDADILRSIIELNQNVFAYFRSNDIFDSYIGSVMALAYSHVQFEDQIERIRTKNLHFHLKYTKKYPQLSLVDKPAYMHVIEGLKKNLKLNHGTVFKRQSAFITSNYRSTNAYFSFFNSKYKISDMSYISGLVKFLKRDLSDLPMTNEIYYHLVRTLHEDFDSISNINDIEGSYIQILRSLFDNPFFIDRRNFAALVQFSKKVFSSKFSLEIKVNFLLEFAQFVVFFPGFIKSDSIGEFPEMPNINSTSMFLQVVDDLSSFVLNPGNSEISNGKLQAMLADGSSLNNITKKIILAIYLQIATKYKWHKLNSQVDPTMTNQTLIQELGSEFSSVNTIFVDSPGEVRIYKSSQSSSFDIPVSEKFFTRTLEKLKEDIEHKTLGSSAMSGLLNSQKKISPAFRKIAQSMSHFAILEKVLSLANEESIKTFYEIFKVKVVEKDETETLRIVVSSMIIRLRNKGFLFKNFDDLIFDFFGFMSKNFKVKLFEPFVVFTENVFRPKYLNFNFLASLSYRISKSSSSNLTLILAYVLRFFRAFPPNRIVRECYARIEKLKDLDSHQSYFAIIVISQLLENYNAMNRQYCAQFDNELISAYSAHIDIDIYKKLIVKLVNLVEMNTTNQDYIILLFGRLEKYHKDGFVQEVLALLVEKVIKFLEDSSFDKTIKNAFLDNYQKNLTLKLAHSESSQYVEYIIDKISKVQTNFSEQFLIIIYFKIVFSENSLRLLQESFGRVIRGRTFIVKQRIEETLKKSVISLPLQILSQFPTAFNSIKASLDFKDSVILVNAFLPSLHSNLVLVNEYFSIAKSMISESQDDSVKAKLRATLSEFYYLNGRFLNLEECVFDKDLIEDLVDFSETISYFS